MILIPSHSAITMVAVALALPSHFYRNLCKAGTFVSQQDNIAPTTSTYDVVNRTLSVTLPDKAITKTEYGFESDRNGKEQFCPRWRQLLVVLTPQVKRVPRAVQPRLFHE